MKVNISVIIIAKNEENRIKDCLDSVAGWAEEIIVIDDESTDKTREIASGMGAKVFVRKMENEGRHRNWANEQAACPWFLSLDADERLTSALREEIAKILANNPKEDLFTIPRKNFIGSYWLQWGGQYPAPQLKVFRKGRFKWEEAEVHPRAFSDGKCGHLFEPMLHYTYRDFSDFLRKLNNQTTLEAKKWLKLSQNNPKKAAKKMNIFNAIWRTVDRFFRAYVGKQGWRDGFYGFMNAFFSGLYQMVSYAKYWEMSKQGIAQRAKGTEKQ